MGSAAADGYLKEEQSSLLKQYGDVRRTTERICAPLNAEDQMVQSMPDASPVKWHQAHTSWFFETFILAPYVKKYRPIDERYTFFFNSYYKQLDVQNPTLASRTWGTSHPVRAQRGLWSRPSLEEVRSYREHVDVAMQRLLEAGVEDEVAALVTVGINHEQQHQELILTDIKHALWTNPLRPAYRERNEHLDPHLPNSGRCRAPGKREEEADPHPPNSGGYGSPDELGPLGWMSYPGERHGVGYEGDGFSFDNERPRHEVLLQSFRIGSRLIANSEYLEFMADGGYSRPELWLSDGWDAVCANGWKAPLYWEEREGEWVVYTLNDERRVNPSEPVCHVSFYEADAYARWAGARLATEFEWEVAAEQLPINGNLLDGNALHPTAALAGNGVQQIFGDVWEWTASPYTAYPGFKPATGVLGEYNGKFMCNQMVLRGGSCATPQSHIRASYRNFFPPQVRWQFSGIRLAND